MTAGSSAGATPPPPSSNRSARSSSSISRRSYSASRAAHKRSARSRTRSRSRSRSGTPAVHARSSEYNDESFGRRSESPEPRQTEEDDDHDDHDGPISSGENGAEEGDAGVDDNADESDDASSPHGDAALDDNAYPITDMAFLNAANEARRPAVVRCGFMKGTRTGCEARGVVGSVSVTCPRRQVAVALFQLARGLRLGCFWWVPVAKRASPQSRCNLRWFYRPGAGRRRSTRACDTCALCRAGCSRFMSYESALHRREASLLRRKFVVRARRASCGLQRTAGCCVANARARHFARCLSGGGTERALASRARRAALFVVGPYPAKGTASAGGESLLRRKTVVRRAN